MRALTIATGFGVGIAGESLVALPSSVLYWPSEGTLFVADLHLGKAASFRAASIPIPLGTTDATLVRLEDAVRATEASRLVILGDLWHDRAGRTPEVERKLESWIGRHRELEIHLVTGNHDLRSGRGTDCAPVTESAELAIGPFVCRHYPESSEGGYVLCGHIHPSVSVKGRGGQGVRLNCFWFGDRVGVVPAFGEFTGSADIDWTPGDIVLGLAGDTVIRIPT
jgi:DNA ligase-associated metallophosphoesterase